MEKELRIDRTEENYRLGLRRVEKTLLRSVTDTEIKDTLCTHMGALGPVQPS